MNLLREKLRACGQHVLRCSDAPDMSGVNAAAEKSAELGNKAFEFYSQVYREGAPDRAAAAALAKEQAGLQNDLSRQQLQVSQEERARYKGTFQPIEQKIAADAMAYDTPARREAAAAAAGADVGMAADAQRQATMRNMERSGALPSSGRVMALQGALDIGTAKAKVGAANTARQQVETLGSAKMMDAAGLGRGVVTNQATTASLGMQAGNSAVGNANNPVNVAAQGAAMMGQGFSTGLQGQNQAMTGYTNVANAQLKADANNAAVWQGIGQAAGAGAAMFASDENLKTDIEPVDPDKALAAVRETPVENWTYRDDMPAADGGQMHTGPMAQDVHRTMGEQAAPAGTMIDPITVTGVTLAAVQALDKKLSKIAAAVGMGGTDKATPKTRSAPAAMAGMPA